MPEVQTTEEVELLGYQEVEAAALALRAALQAKDAAMESAHAQGFRALDYTPYDEALAAIEEGAEALLQALTPHLPALQETRP